MLYDVGSLILAFNGTGSVTDAGNLYLEYEIEFNQKQTNATYTPANYMALRVASDQSIATTVAELLVCDTIIYNNMFLTTAATGQPSYSTSTGVWTNMPCGVFQVYGQINFHSTAATANDCLVELLVDGASASPQMLVEHSLTSTSAAQFFNVPFTFIVTFASGSASTMSIQVTQTAAGTLNINASRTRIYVRAL